MAFIINNADDFGYSRAVNYGIIDSFQRGVLTSATVMANMPGFDHAVMLAKENPELGVGVHLTLTAGRPILNGHQTIADEGGRFRKRVYYCEMDTPIDEEEVYAEWKAQIERVLSNGILPTHLDSHHHIHTFRNNLPVFLRLAKEYDLPVRNSFQNPGDYRDAGVECCDVLINPWIYHEDRILGSPNKGELLAEEIIRQIEGYRNIETMEVMWHPSYIDSVLLDGSSWVRTRVYERDAIDSEVLRNYIMKNHTLCSYRELGKGV